LDAGTNSPINLPRLVTAYFTDRPDPGDPGQRVAFGTSGHRGSSLDHAFNERHILAISQAICRHRQEAGITGPLFLGIDTHALSEPAMASAIEVFAANDVTVMIAAHGGYTPTPAVSHAILTYNRGRSSGLADGVVITPSHNPPEDGGFKYNPPNGGPASAEITGAIERAANAFLEADMEGVRRIPYERALHAANVHEHDFAGPYVDDLPSILDIDVIRASGITIGIDPLGGAAVDYWPLVAERHGLALTVVNDAVDASFRFMPHDWDGRIRMDCSSPHAMAGLIGMRDRFDIAFANDTDADRHGIVCRSAGLLPPNHFLAASIAYLFGNRPDWGPEIGVGKTIVSSSMIDRVCEKLGRRLFEVPVGFKWFVDGLMDGTLGFVGEESAGATFLRRDGSVWTTDKDGLVMGLLAAEMTARAGRDPGELYAGLTAELGAPSYARIDAPANAAQKSILKSITAQQLEATTLAGDPVIATVNTAPGNGEKIGGIKVSSAKGWYAARPSGTENVYKIYAESFEGDAHLARVQDEARAGLTRAFEAGDQARR
jgi:phosphoglucomutase